MKKLILVCQCIILTISLLQAQQPETVYSIAKIYKPHNWYLKQAELWYNEIQKNKSNESAWYNYFMANRMAGFEFDNKGDTNKKCYEETQFLSNTDTIVSQAQRYIPNTFTSEYIIWRNHGSTPEDFPHLAKAYSINPNFYGIAGEMVSYYETQNNTAKRTEFNKKWYQLSELAPGVLNYNYNVLMTMKTKAAIITFGDNDSFPIWMLQDALGIRPDVTVLNTSLLCIVKYRETIFKQLNIPAFTKSYDDGATPANTEEVMNHILKNKPKDLSLYIGLPAWKQSNFNSSNFYLVGLALQYSLENIDNLAELRNNFENKYALDYIQYRFEYELSPEIIDRMNINYLPGIFKLFQHYSISGNTQQANKIKELGLAIAQKGGDEWFTKAQQILK